MSITKELIEQERQFVQTGKLREVHLHKEGTFLRAYDWSAWLCCHYLHDFKVNKRQFKGIDEPVAYIGFPETSLQKWTPEGSEQRAEGDKHLVLTLPEVMVTDDLDVLSAAYSEWKEGIPLTESQPGLRKRGGGKDADSDVDDFFASPATLTGIMQRILAFPIESRSPLESMTFLADVKRQLAALV